MNEIWLIPLVDEHYQFIPKTTVKGKNKPWLELISDK
jgi:hypothetical protein